MRKKLGILFFAVVVVFAFYASRSQAQTNTAQTPNPTPSPTPLLIYWDYSVVEKEDSEKRVFVVEIELGKKKSANKDLLADLKEAELPIVSINANGFVVSYPKSTTDCKVFADAKKIADIAIKYFPKTHVVRFNWGIFLETFYQTVPSCEGTANSSTTPSPP